MKALAWLLLWPLVVFLWLVDGPTHGPDCGCNDCWALRHREVLR